MKPFYTICTVDGPQREGCYLTYNEALMEAKKMAAKSGEEVIIMISQTVVKPRSDYDIEQVIR